MRLRSVIACLIGLFIVAGCKKNKAASSPVPEPADTMAVKTPVTGIRIAWDYSTLKKVSGNGNYCGYARVIQLGNEKLLCVYEQDGNIVSVRSEDSGRTWAAPQTIAARQEGINMTVPDILKLNDNSLLVCYNPRPYAIDGVRRFAIRTKKSNDGGETWKDERLLYEAGTKFEDGCWEPSAVQLPSGEIRLYFANEGPYTTSNEQEISMLRSMDNGLSWTTNPETVSFRPGSRDGMPVPVLLQNKKDILIAIEDNGFVNFKPYLIKSSVSGNNETVGAGSPNRIYALADKLSEAIYAGAPYLRQLHRGETLLAYQGTEGRMGNSVEYSEMKVVIGNENGRNFNRKTVPFSIPLDKSGLWNSIQVLENDEVIALTSTNAYSPGRTEVWMIKGYVVPELEASKATITVDGLWEEEAWMQPFPVFIGHKSLTQARSRVNYDEQYLFVLSSVRDAGVHTNAINPESSDGLTVYLNISGKSYEKPDKGNFSFFLSASGQLQVKQGEKGSWKEMGNAAGILSASKKIETGYRQEMAIPWELIGGKPAAGTRLGLNIRLTENTGKSNPDYYENISAGNEHQPYTWLSLWLK